MIEVISHRSTSMTHVTVSLPDDLAQQAQAAGLLNESAVVRLLRRALRERSASERLGEIFEKLDAQGEPPMSDEEVAEEIAAARREHPQRN
jgi:Arc/MetJ family transcription regulator